MKVPGQWRRVEHRAPSRAVCCAKVTPHGGVVFRMPGDNLEQHFVPADDLARVFGDADSYVAYMLSKECVYR